MTEVRSPVVGNHKPFRTDRPPFAVASGVVMVVVFWVSPDDSSPTAIIDSTQCHITVTVWWRDGWFGAALVGLSHRCGAVVHAIVNLSRCDL